MFYLSFIYLLLEINIYPSQWVFFISVQFLILFRLIALFVWYSILFIRLYFASKSCQKYIFFGVIFNQTWKQQTFQLKFYTFFLYFSNEFFIVFNFYFDWIYFCFIFETLLTSYRNKINRFCWVFRHPLYCPSYRASQYRLFGLKLSVSHLMFHIFVWWLCCTPLKYLLARRILFFLLTSYQNKINQSHQQPFSLTKLCELQTTYFIYHFYFVFTDFGYLKI